MAPDPIMTGCEHCPFVDRCKKTEDACGERTKGAQGRVRWDGVIAVALYSAALIGLAFALYFARNSEKDLCPVCGKSTCDIGDMERHLKAEEGEVVEMPVGGL